jgi:hypothetical protein
MSRFLVYAPRQEHLVIDRDENGIVRERRVLEEHTATQIAFEGKSIKADAQGRFEVSQEDHDRLVGQHGFESAGAAEDEPGKKSVPESDNGPVKSDVTKSRSPRRKKERA